MTPKTLNDPTTDPNLDLDTEDTIELEELATEDIELVRGGRVSFWMGAASA